MMEDVYTTPAEIAEYVKGEGTTPNAATAMEAAMGNCPYDINKVK